MEEKEIRTHELAKMLLAMPDKAIRVYENDYDDNLIINSLTRIENNDDYITLMYDKNDATGRMCTSELTPNESKAYWDIREKYGEASDKMIFLMNLVNRRKGIL